MSLNCIVIFSLKLPVWCMGIGSGDLLFVLCVFIIIIFIKCAARN